MNPWTPLLGNAAFGTALVTAIVTILGWVTTRAYGLFQKWTEAREKRRIAIVRFYADVRIRAEGLVGFLDPQSIETLVAAIRDYDSRALPFRVYGAQVTDSRSQERINIYLHTFSSEDAYLIRKYILFDRLLALEYDKLQSDAFEALSGDRKIAATQSCFATGRELKAIAEDLQALIESWPGIGDSRRQGSQDEGKIR